MSNPNRKFRTLSQMVQETEEHACQRCDIWRVVAKEAPLATLEEAQKHICKCDDYCGWEFCGADGPARPEYAYHDDPTGEYEQDIYPEYDREADYWSWR